MREHDAPKISRGILNNETGGSQRILLLVLALVLLLFGYVYFFTGLITSHEEVVKAPVVEAPVIKKPLPPRSDKKPADKKDASVKAEKPAQPAEEKKAEVAQAAKPAPDGAKPVPPKVAPPAQVSPKEVAKPAAPVKPKETAAAKPAQPAKAAETKQKVKAEKQPKTPEKQPAYTLLIGDYVLNTDIKKVEGQLKKSGVTKFATTKVKKAAPMHRIYVAEFPTDKEAQTELKKMKKFTQSAFVLPGKGKYTVYAGSYYIEGQAAKEKDRLQKINKDLKLTIQKVEVKVGVTRLTAGSFTGKEKAVTEAERLRKAGIAAKVVASK